MSAGRAPPIKLRLSVIALALLLAVSSSTVALWPADAGSSYEASAAAYPPPSASRVVDAVFYSQSLDMEVPYLVYLPPGYDSSSARRYPVMFMLHGLDGDRFMWQKLGLFEAADSMISSGEIDPVIIVTPEGQRSYWVDHANNGPRWGTYVARDLVGDVESKYRTYEARESRAIGGISMGGHGALQIAIRTNKFGVVGAHSVALRRHDEAFTFFGDKKYFEEHDPVTLCSRYRERADSLTIWLDMGSEDVWYGRAAAFHDQLVAASIDHKWAVYPGNHDGAYWRAHIPEYLRFYTFALESPR